MRSANERVIIQKHSSLHAPSAAFAAATLSARCNERIYCAASGPAIRGARRRRTLPLVSRCIPPELCFVGQTASRSQDGPNHGARLRFRVSLSGSVRAPNRCVFVASNTRASSIGLARFAMSARAFRRVAPPRASSASGLEPLSSPACW